jgi:hypothetical protein
MKSSKIIKEKTIGVTKCSTLSLSSSMSSMRIEKKSDSKLRNKSMRK